ncbi:MMPL family transporter [Nocardioides daeguensis]|uniref:Membrane transport protein MMPL domain-containing protein n=1 Tax=Nocardioides daeguensis TaxID=908359 RepID=A0ABP6V0I6_9ACTN|nr:MMPL family transporter [Nocardioides daeguensis]MBV6728783.1 MMPL family transporter [Nocardioides daeguensis]MCR1773607.1 MMPL family transporter [Nocardioides daeguensis]
MPVRALLRLAVVGLLLAGIGLGLARVRTDTTASSFLPGDDAAQVATSAAARSFGGDPVVVVAESATDGALLGPDELLKLVGLEGALAQLPDVSVVYGPGTVLNQIATQARNLLATISGRRDALQQLARERARAQGLNRAAAQRAAEAAVRRYDRRYGGLLVQGLPAGLPTLRNPGFAKAVVFDEDGTPRQQWRFVVPRRDAVAVIVRPREGLDQAATDRLVAAVSAAVDDAGLATDRVTVTGMPVVAAGLADVLKREMPVIGGVALALTTLCYLLLPWIPRSPRRVVPVLTTGLATAATLAVFGWLDHPVSLGVVAFLPILLGTGSDFPAYLVRGADRRTVVVAGLAAASGFATLLLSPLPLVRDLGIALAVGVVLTLALGLAVSRRYGAPTTDEAEPDRPASHRSLGRAPRLSLLGAGLALAAIGWAVLPGLDIEADPERLIAGAPGTAAIDHAEEVLGSSGEVQLLVRGDDVTSPETLAWMTQVQDVVVRRFGDRLHLIVSPPSLLGFLGSEPTSVQVEAGLAQVPDYLRASVIRDDRRQAVLSFGIELGDVAAQRALLADVLRDVPPPPDGVTLDLAGLPVVAGRSYALLSEHRYLHAGVGIVAAGLVLALGLRRRREALLAVGAAVLATGWGFLVAQLLGLPLTPLTLALGSLATATACEFTVLLGAARHRRVLVRSVLVAATAATSGYLALGASDLAVIRGFGLFLAATVGLSLLASYVVRLVLPSTATARPAPVQRATPAQPRVEVLV